MRLLRILPWIAAPLTLLAASCRDPTEITVRVTTDLACNQTPGLAKAWVASAGTELEAPSCTPQTPDNYVGTIVIVPGPAGDDAKVEVTVVGSVNAASNDTCLASKKNVGDCLVVRRRLSFIPHTPLTLPIRLDSRCLNVQCKDSETCIEGACKPVDVDPVPPPSGDAGAADVGTDAPIAAPLDALDLFAGNDGTCALLKTKEIVCWGNNADGQLLAKAKPVAAPETIASLSTATEIALGAHHGCALLRALNLPSTVVCWGDNSAGQLADAVVTSSSALVAVALPDGTTPSQLRAGKDFTCLLGKPKSSAAAESPVFCWGDDSLGQSSGSGIAGKKVVPATPVPNVTGALLALGDAFVCSGRATVTTCQTSCPVASCWGDNALKQAHGLTPIAAPSDVFLSLNKAAPTQLETGASHATVTIPNLTTYGWGNNADLQLPGATGSPVVNPTQLSLPKGPRALGAHHTCALVQGTVSCWGTGAVVTSMLKDGGVKKLVSGSNHACVIDATDHVQCWGDNSLGQLGSSNPAESGPRIVGNSAL